jgi:hypothetical protein
MESKELLPSLKERALVRPYLEAAAFRPCPHEVIHKRHVINNT